MLINAFLTRLYKFYFFKLINILGITIYALKTLDMAGFFNLISSF